MQKWKYSREIVTFIDKDMTVNWKFFCAEDAHAKGQLLGSLDHVLLPQHLILYPPLFLDAFCLEIDRYIGLPIFFPIFKHFTIIRFDYFFCHIYNYTEYNQQQWWSVTKYNYFVTVLKYIFQVSVLYWSSFILSNFYFYFTTFQSIRSYFLLHYIS